MKYLAVFLRKIGEYKKIKVDKKGEKTETKTVRPNYVRVGTKKFKPTDEYITYQKDSSYPIQLEAYSEQHKDTLIYYYDYDNMSLIGLEVLLKYKFNPKDLNKAVGKITVEQIIAGAKAVTGNPLAYIILPIITLVAGLLMGYYFGGGFNTA